MRRFFPRGTPGAIIFCLLAAASARAAEPVERVDELGRPQLLQIHGTKVFTAEEIRQAVSTDREVRQAAHHGAPLNAYLELIHNKIDRGYRDTGFQKPSVKAQVDRRRGRIDVAIEEGQRFYNGDVHIQGAKALSPGELIDAIVKPGRRSAAISEHPDGRDGDPVLWIDKKGKTLRPSLPAWEIGEPAIFDPSQIKWVEDAMRRLYADAGRHVPKFRIDMVPDDATGMVALRVKIVDEGPASRIGAIEITGNTKNSAAAVEQFLGLKTGNVWTRREQTRMERALWHSGRFLDYAFDVVPSTKPDEPFRLKLHLTEYPAASPLAEPLSPKEAALLKARQWLIDYGRRGDDILWAIHDSNFTVELVVSAQHGALALVGTPGDDVFEYLQFAFVGGKKLLGCYAPLLHEKLQCTEFTWQTLVEQELRLRLGKKKPFSFFLGFGYRSVNTSEAGGSVRVSLNFPPVVALAMAHEKSEEIACTLADGELRLRGEEFLARFNAATGQLLSMEIGGEAEEEKWSISFVRGAFAARFKRLEEITASDREVYNRREPLSSLVSFFCDARPWNRFCERDEREAVGEIADLVRKFIDGGVLIPLDELVCDMRDRPDPAFAVPEPSFYFKFTTSMADLLPVAGLFLADYSDQLFPPGSWAASMAEEYGLAWAGQGKYLAEELRRLMRAGEFGPIGCRLSKLASPGDAAEIDEKQSDLSAEQARTLNDFRRECQVLLDRRGAVGRCCLQAVQTLRTLDDSEVEHLLKLLPKEWVRSRWHLNKLRENPEQPLSAALAAMLDDVWEMDLRNTPAVLFTDEPKQPAVAILPHWQRYIEDVTSPLASAERMSGKTDTPASGVGSRVGLEGYCPVSLEQRKWVVGSRSWCVVYRGREYYCGSAADAERFRAHPQWYAPTCGGYDIVRWIDHDQMDPGSRAHGVFYSSRVLMFADETSLQAFNNDPQRYLNSEKLSQLEDAVINFMNTLDPTPPFKAQVPPEH